MPSSEEWIMSMALIYTVEYYLAVKRHEIMEFADKLDETGKKNKRSKYMTDITEYEGGR